MKPAKGLNRQKTEAREYQTRDSGLFFNVSEVLYDAKSPYQTIEIVSNRDYGRILLLDGLIQTTEKDEFFYHEMLVHPVLASHPEPESVLIIGGGDGGALREALKYPLSHATLVEIDAQVVEACRRHFPWLENALRDARAELVVADGNAFIEETADGYDVIIVDSSDPVGPSTILHQEEFYRKLQSKLRPGGAIAAQSGSLLLHQESHILKSAFLDKIFRYSRLYLGPVPTYPVGMWCYHFLSDEIDPLAGRELHIPEGLRYFNAEVFQASFSLPNFLKEKMK